MKGGVCGGGPTEGVWVGGGCGTTAAGIGGLERATALWVGGREGWVRAVAPWERGSRGRALELSGPGIAGRIGLSV